MTTSARTSWNLPLEELLGPPYVPSLRAVQKTVLMVLLAIILGPISLTNILAAPAIVHRHLAHAPRQRKSAIRYPVQDLF